MGILENVSAHLWKYKTEHKLSIVGLAKKLNIGKTTIYNYLHQKGNPSLGTLTHLAQQMDIPLEDLLAPVDRHSSRHEDTKEYLLELKQMLEVVE